MWNGFNEPFAVSQYRLLILRHAWLNLWDKHMTTGRINQVTIVTVHRARKPKCAGTPPEGRTESSQDRGRPKPGPACASSRDRSRPERGTHHPIAPSEFPKRWSAADASSRPPEESGPSLQHAPLKRRIPATCHVLGRLQASGDPQMSYE